MTQPKVKPDLRLLAFVLCFTNAEHDNTDNWETPNSNKTISPFITFILRYRTQNGGHFVAAWVCLHLLKYADIFPLINFILPPTTQDDVWVNLRLKLTHQDLYVTEINMKTSRICHCKVCMVYYFCVIDILANVCTSTQIYVFFKSKWT